MRRYAPIFLVLAIACGGGGGDKVTGPAPVVSVSLSASVTTLNVGQTATLTASPKDASGNVLTGRTVTWSTSSAAIATVSTAGVVTGVALGSVVITATVETKTAQTAITITQAGPDCTGVTPVSVTVGQVRVLGGAEKSLLCLTSSATAASEYVLIPANLPATRLTASVTLLSSNTLPATGPPASALDAQATAAAARVVTMGTAGAANIASLQSVRGHMPRNMAFERALRAREFAMARAFRAARVSARARPALLRAPANPLKPGNVGTLPATPALGTLVTLNAQANSACSQPINRVAKVMAVTNSAIVVEDTLRPAGGFTAADYLSIATTFDTLVYSLDTTAFGAPADIDGNGRIVLFFTSAVNQLTTTGQFGVIGGFFFNRDLVPPLVANAEAGGPCATSNFGEMFYLPVVDPAKTINVFFSDKASMFIDVNSTTVHEFQHLINSSRRYYIQTALVNDEESWLNEGMSHLAEELLYLRVSGLSSRSDLTFATSAGTQGSTLYNNMLSYMADNMDRFNSYLLGPETYGAYADIVDANDLQTRGASWALLRYALDQSQGANALYLRALINATTEGVPNFNTVFGGIGGFAAALRGEIVANFTDNAGLGAAAQYTHPSWNFRDWLPHFTANNSKYPLFTRSLLGGASVPLSLGPGSSSFLRFRVNAGATAGISTVISGAAASAVDLILVRTQ